MYTESDNLSPLTTSPITTTTRNNTKKDPSIPSNRIPITTISSDSMEGEKWESLEMSEECDSKKSITKREEIPIEYEEVVTETKQHKKRKQQIHIHKKPREDYSIDDLFLGQTENPYPNDDCKPLSLTMGKLPKFKNMPRLSTTQKFPVLGNLNCTPDNLAEKIQSKEISINSPHSITTNNYNFNFQKSQIAPEVKGVSDDINEIKSELQKSHADISNLKMLLSLRNDKIMDLEETIAQFQSKGSAVQESVSLQTESDEPKLRGLESQIIALKSAITLL